MRKLPILLAAGAALGSAGLALATPALSPLATFGGGDGWLAPGEGGYAYLGTGNLERGMAYNPATGHVLLVSRANPTSTNGQNVRILDGSTGADLGGLQGTGTLAASGATFAVNMVGVADDGAIYVGNLMTSATGTFRVFRWDNEAAAAPTTAYEASVGGLPRVGDAFDVFGSGANTRIVAAGGGTTLNSNFAAFTTADGLTYASQAYPSIAGTSSGTTNDFRLGITFTDSDTIVGSQGGFADPPTNSIVAPSRVADFAGASASIVANPVFSTGSQRLMDYAVIAGIPVLAVQDTVSSTVYFYNFVDPQNPTLLISGNNTTGTLTGNGNGVGQVKFGAITGDTAVVYAMSTNQGIQAFSFTVPEPATMSLLAVGAAGLLRRRRA
jgi:hypothetical protein